MVDHEVHERTLAELEKELARWKTFAGLIAAEAYGDSYIICDCNERVVERVDKPRVKSMPTLAYAPPAVDKQNWTLYPEKIAQSALIVLDESVPEHAPHRALHLRELTEERILAAERGVDLLRSVESVESDTPRRGR